MARTYPEAPRLVLSLLAGWRVSLRRTRADWPIVAAAWLTTLLAAVLLSAGPIYSSAASVAGLRRTLADAPVTSANLQLSTYGAPSEVAAADAPVRTELRNVIAPVGGSIVREGRTAGTLTLPEQPASGPGNVALLGFLDNLRQHATLVTGAWPTDGGDASGPIPVVVLESVATDLGLHVGDELPMTASVLDASVTVPVRLVGIYTIGRADDPYWFGDPQLLTGVSANARYQTFGPFFTTPNDLLQRTGGVSLRLQWRAFPDFAKLTVDGASQLKSRLDALPDRLASVTGANVSIETGLSTILGDAERSLLVSRTGVLLLMAQLGILAAYAIILTASLLVDHRRIDTALLRSRGAGPWQVALLALAEALVLVVPAVLLAPWVALGALHILDVVGPLADVGLAIHPRVTTDGYLAAAAAGIICVALLVLPAVVAARRFAAEQGGLSRHETRTFGQRLGIDLALLILTAIGLWQLRLYGAPLTRTVQGTLGLDPLLVAAPAIGLLAGGVLALRILPLLAEAVERVLARGRALVGSLGSRQLARRPLRYTRSALLLMLAMSMGVFALSYSATWSSSQVDQAAYQSGADARVVPGHTLGALPAWALPSAYAQLAGAGALSPVERITNGVSVASGSGDLLALDAETAARIVLFRPDEATTSLDALMQALRQGRPQPSLVRLPDGTSYLRVVPQVQISTIGTIVVDPSSRQVNVQPIDPATLSDLRVSANAVIRDAHGLLYRVESGVVPLTGSGTELLLPLEPIDTGSGGTVSAGAHLDGPLELAAVGIQLWLPQDTITTRAALGVAAVSAGGAAAGPWTALSLGSVGGWSAQMAQGRGVLTAVAADQVQGTSVELAGLGGQGAIFGNGTSTPAARLSFLPSSLASFDQAIPVIANSAFLSASGATQGDTIPATVDGTLRHVRIVGTVASFPTTDPTRPLLVVDEPTLALLRLQATSDVVSADEWWISTGSGTPDTLAAALRADPFDSTSVVSVDDRARSLSADPVAVGIIGALLLGSVAAGLFAIVGLTVSAAVSARQRRTEFALLRALGLSGRQLAGWLWLENGSLVLVSLLAGTGLGLLIGWLVLPFVTVTQQAAAPVPPVVVDIPWGRIGILEAASAIALAVAVVLIGAVLRRLGVGSILRMGED